MSTISQNNIVVNYVITSDQIAKTKTEFDKLTDAEKKAVDETKKLNDSLKKTGQEGGQSVKNVGNEMNNLSGIVKSGAGLLAGFFAVSSLKDFAVQVFNVTAEFQKLSAVLTNTLGSSSAAQGAMSSIQKFASQTPFSVQELTSSFVKLANQGFTPTVDQLRKLGDLASSTGKGFDQLAEAIIDAQTGEFERLKEFGIRASKAGDNVTFTFKGVQTQTKNTNDAIREYILSLGDLQGVSGAMAGVSATLGGQISNLGDAWDSLLNTIGTNLAPIYQKALGLTSSFLTKLNDLFGGKQIAEAGEQFNKIYEKYNNASQGALENAKINTTNIIKTQKEKIEALKKTFNEESKLSETIREEYRAAGSEYDDVQQQKITTSRTVTAQEISDQEKILAAYELNLDVANKLLNDKKKVGSETQKITDAELKALKLAFDARMQMLNLEKQERELRGKLANDPNAGLTAQMKFLEAELALKKEYQGKGLAIKDIEIIITKEKLELAKKDYEAALMDNYGATVDNEEAKEKARKASMDQTVKDNKEMIDAVNKDADQALKDELKRIQDAIDAQKKKEKQKAEIIQASIDLAAETTNSLFNLQSQYAARDMERKQKQFDEEIRLADGNQQKITEINEKRAAAEKEYRLKEFRANQLQAIANVVFNTAPIIAQYLAKVVTAPLAIIAAASATAQIGFILAQPPPEFAEGTKGKKYKGRAIVGEQGTEKVVTQSGRVYYTPPVATLAQFDEPVEIIPNHQLGLNDRKQLSLIYGNRSTSSDSGGKIIEKLSNIEIGLKNMPVAAISLDERGFMKKVRTPNRSTTILNNRFKN